MAGYVPSDYANSDVIDAFLKDFRIPLPIHGYDSSIAKQVKSLLEFSV